MILDETLDELERLANLASKGEWTLVERNEYAHISCNNDLNDDDIVGPVLAWNGSEQEMHDIRFITAANPNTIKWLVNEIRDLTNLTNLSI